MPRHPARLEIQLPLNSATAHPSLLATTSVTSVASRSHLQVTAIKAKAPKNNHHAAYEQRRSTQVGVGLAPHPPKVGKTVTQKRDALEEGGGTTSQAIDFGDF